VNTGTNITTRKEGTRLSALFKFLATAFPVAAMLSVLPAILEFPPLKIPQNMNTFQVVVVIPFYLGLLAMPGYLCALWGAPGNGKFPRWIRGSVYLGLVSAVLGTFLGALVVAPGVLALATVITTILLIKKLRKDALL
jgi:hypothetical protein